MLMIEAWMVILTASYALYPLILRSLAQPSVSKDEARKPFSVPHGSPGDAKHRPETALTHLLTMRDY